jgi:hypothetical protein
VATSGVLPGSLVHIRIKMPVKLSQEQRQIMEDFARLETDTPGNNPEGTVSRDQSKKFLSLIVVFSFLIKNLGMDFDY